MGTVLTTLALPHADLCSAFQRLFRRPGLRVVHGGQRREDPPGQALLRPAEGVLRRHRRRQESLRRWPGAAGWVKHQSDSNFI